MNMKIIFGILVLALGASTVGFTNQKLDTQSIDKARRIMKAYNAKCNDEGNAAIDVVARYCDCRTREMFRVVSVDDMIHLLHNDNRSLAERAKVSNQNSVRENLESLEADMAAKCSKKILKR